MRGWTKPASGQRRLPVAGVVHRVRPHVRPHRVVDAVARPDRAVGEADLASHRHPALRAAAALDLGQDIVGRGNVEIGCLVGDRCDGVGSVVRRDQPGGEFVDREHRQRIQPHRPQQRRSAPVHNATATTMPTIAAAMAPGVPRPAHRRDERPRGEPAESAADQDADDAPDNAHAKLPLFACSINAVRSGRSGHNRPPVPAPPPMNDSNFVAPTASARPAVRALMASQIREVANAGMGEAGVLPFWFGEPDEVTPAFIRDAAAQSLARGETFYSQNFGIPELREAIGAYVSRLHRPTSAGQIAVTASGMSALMLTVEALVAPGDRVVVVTPLWPNLVEIPKILSANVVCVPLDVHRGGLDARPRPAARGADARHARGDDQFAQQSDRLDDFTRGPAGDPRALPPPRHLDRRRRRVRAAGLRRRALARRRSSTSPRPTTGWSAPTASRNRG